jgi:hypothetical protein
MPFFSVFSAGPERVLREALFLYAVCVKSLLFS